jgi:hypothetical protein
MEERSSENQTGDFFVADEETTRFVKEQLRKGRLEEYIIDVLVSKGMDKVKAKYIVHDISYYSDPNLNASSSKGMVLMIAGIVTFCVGVLFLLFFFFGDHHLSIAPMLSSICLIIGGVGIVLRGHSMRFNND